MKGEVTMRPRGLHEVFVIKYSCRDSALYQKLILRASNIDHLTLYSHYMKILEGTGVGDQAACLEAADIAGAQFWLRGGVACGH